MDGRSAGGSHGAYSEVDTGAFAIHMLREWRRWVAGTGSSLLASSTCLDSDGHGF